MGHNFNFMRLLTLLPTALLLTLPVQAAGTIKMLYTFSGGADGGTPKGSLIEDTKGNLYGTASVGGDLECAPPLGCGTVFKLTTANKLIVLYTFKGGTDGATPSATLLMDAGGNLYGTTSAGGGAKGCFGNGCGTVFKIDPAGTETVLYRFKGKTDGGLPYSTLVMDSAGDLYGTTQAGGDLSCSLGSGGCGTVFKLSKTGNETVLYSFKGGADGAYPASETLVMDSKDDLYGTASHGGDLSCNPPNGCGTVFVLAKTGKLTPLHTFTGEADGAFPQSGVVLFKNILYGTTIAGGKYNLGTFYTINLAADVLEDPLGEDVFVNEHNFAGAPKDGARPYAAPYLDLGDIPDKVAIIITAGGGDENFGAVIAYGYADNLWDEEGSFEAQQNGNGPLASPVLDLLRGALVGTTSQGGPERKGSPNGGVWANFPLPDFL